MAISNVNVHLDRVRMVGMRFDMIVVAGWHPIHASWVSITLVQQVVIVISWVCVTWYFNVIATMDRQDLLRRKRRDQTAVGTSFDVPVIDVLTANSSCGQMLHSIYLPNVVNQVVMVSRNGLVST